MLQQVWRYRISEKNQRLCIYCKDQVIQVFRNKQEVDKAVREMDGESFQGNRLRVEVAGRPQRKKGPQPNDECRYCRRLGHWYFFIVT